MNLLAAGVVASVVSMPVTTRASAPGEDLGGGFLIGLYVAGGATLAVTGAWTLAEGERLSAWFSALEVLLYAIPLGVAAVATANADQPGWSVVSGVSSAWFFFHGVYNLSPAAPGAGARAGPVQLLLAGDRVEARVGGVF